MTLLVVLLGLALLALAAPRYGACRSGRGGGLFPPDAGEPRPASRGPSGTGPGPGG